MNWKNFTWALPYGDQFRRQRRYMHDYMNPHAISALRSIQTKSVHSLLDSLLKDPDRFDKHVYRSANTNDTVNTLASELLG